MEIKDVVNGIAIKLNNSFPGYTVYVDKIPQNFKQPSFLIQLLSMDYVRQIGKRWYVAPLFNIQYFNNEGNVDRFNHSLLINQALESIELINGDIILARGISSEVADDIVNCFMRFDFYLNEIQLKDYMETLQLNTKLREVL